jgi:DNA-binding transcriptional ArsR family regulator
MKTKNASEFSKVSEPVLEFAAGCFQALSDPTRLKILQALKDGAKTVHDLVVLFSWTQPNISRHLAILAKSGMVRKTKKGQFVYYSVANMGVFDLCDMICNHVNTTFSVLGKPFK